MLVIFDILIYKWIVSKTNGLNTCLLYCVELQVCFEIKGISLICMRIHNARAARCHWPSSGQPAIRALTRNPLRGLPLSVLLTIVTSSYQTTCNNLPEIFNKRHTHANRAKRSKCVTLPHTTLSVILKSRKLNGNPTVTTLLQPQSYSHFSVWAGH